MRVIASLGLVLRLLALTLAAGLVLGVLVGSGFPEVLHDGVSPAPAAGDASTATC
jgi:hypothetical protein